MESSGATYPDVDFRVASATDLSTLADDSFDAVVASEVIEQIADHDQVVANVARALTPGGLW